MTSFAEWYSSKHSFSASDRHDRSECILCTGNIGSTVTGMIGAFASKIGKESAACK
jgi:hypothetical protein